MTTDYQPPTMRLTHDGLFLEGYLDYRKKTQISDDGGITWEDVVTDKTGQIQGLKQGKTYQFRLVDRELPSL
jgi:hypothetical protein